MISGSIAQSDSVTIQGQNLPLPVLPIDSTPTVQQETKTTTSLIDTLNKQTDSLLTLKKKADSLKKLPKPWLPIDTAWSVPALGINELSGRFDYRTKKGFVRLPAQLTDGTKGYYLRIPAARALDKMIKAASKDGIRLRVVSATRSFNEQKAIWERKWNGTNSGPMRYDTIGDPVHKALAITTFSSMPGTSRHHWGTDIDLNSVEPKAFEKGAGLKTYQWLSRNASKFGFCQVYKGKANGRTGYQDEAWHWSYLPLARPFLDQYLRKVPLNQVVKGFSGSEALDGATIENQFIQGIAPECK